jgi:hypothetical protein
MICGGGGGTKMNSLLLLALLTVDVNAEAITSSVQGAYSLEVGTVDGERSLTAGICQGMLVERPALHRYRVTVRMLEHWPMRARRSSKVRARYDMTTGVTLVSVGGKPFSEGAGGYRNHMRFAQDVDGGWEVGVVWYAQSRGVVVRHSLRLPLGA